MDTVCSLVVMNGSISRYRKVEMLDTKLHVRLHRSRALEVATKTVADAACLVRALQTVSENRDLSHDRVAVSPPTPSPRGEYKRKRYIGA